MLSNFEQTMKRLTLSMMDLCFAIRAYHDAANLARQVRHCPECGQLLHSEQCPRCTPGRDLN